METIILMIAAFLISVIAAYGYYLILKEKDELFEQKKQSKTRYRTNEEFINN